MSPLSLVGPEPLRRFAILCLTVFFAALGIAAVAALCWCLVPPIDKTPAFAAQFTVLPDYLYAGQPAKSVAFEACCAAAPFLLCFSFHVAQKITGGLSHRALRRFVRTALVLHVAFWCWCVRPIFHYPHPPLFAPRWLLMPRIFPPPGPSWAWMAALLGGALLLLWAQRLQPTRRARNRVVAALFLLGLLLAPNRLLAPSEINDESPFTYHLNSVLDALSQVTNGHHVLVDFPHIYGGYVEILGAVLRLLPRTLGAPLLVLGLPSVFGVFFLLLAARLILPRPLILLLTGLILLGVAYVPSVPDPVYGYNTARAFFPALGLLVAVLYYRKPGLGRYLLVSAIAAVAPVWNLDTGLVLWGGWLLTLLALGISDRCWRRVAGQAAAQVAFLLAATVTFLLYLRIVSGSWPRPEYLFYFQSLVVRSGYFCLPLIVPSAWTALVLLYLTGLAVAFFAHYHRRVRPETRIILLLSLLGLGTFSYYMGRSAETNLLGVCPPAVLLLGLLTCKLERQIRLGLSPALARWFLLPWAIMVLWWALLLFAQLPLLLHRSFQFAHDWPSTSRTSFDTKVKQVRDWIHPGDPGVYFLSNHSGYFYYLSQTVRSLRIPGTIELLKTSDLDVLLGSLRERQIAKLVVDPHFADTGMYRPDVYRAIDAAIAQNYDPVGTTPPGGLLLCQPRPPGRSR